MMKKNNNKHNFTIQELTIKILDCIQYDDSCDDFILWTMDGEDVLGRFETKEDALISGIATYKPPDESNLTPDGKIQIKGQLLSRSEYEDLASMREFQQ